MTFVEIVLVALAAGAVLGGGMRVVSRRRRHQPAVATAPTSPLRRSTVTLVPRTVPQDGAGAPAPGTGRRPHLAVAGTAAPGDDRDTIGTNDPNDDNHGDDHRDA